MNDGATLGMQVPDATYPEYRLLLVWRADADGNGIRCYFEHHEPGGVIEPLQASFHPTLDLHDAVESALTHFFEERDTDETQK